MKQNFDHSLEMLLHHEGGFVNHPKDPGGVTNLGVTKKVFEKWVGREVSVDEMKALTPTDVAPIYKKITGINYGLMTFQLAWISLRLIGV